MASFLLKTWNCFGTAQSALAFLRWRGVPDSHRFELPEVKQAVLEADIVCLQELFMSEAEAFFDRLDHGHKARVDNRSTLFPLTFGGSGLGIASRFPIVSQTVRSFSRPQVGTERFARKGVLHARLDVGDTHLDVVTTHLQSGYTPKARQVRARQLREIANVVEELGSADRPFIVCGDLNIDGLSDALAADELAGEYQALRAALPAFEDLGAEGDAATFHPHPEINELAHRFEAHGPRQRIDYVLFRPSKAHELRAEGCEIALHEPFFPEGRPRTFASDHFALRARFSLRPAGSRAHQTE